MSLAILIWTLCTVIPNIASIYWSAPRGRVGGDEDEDEDEEDEEEGEEERSEKGRRGGGGRGGVGALGGRGEEKKEYRAGRQLEEVGGGKQHQANENRTIGRE